MNIIWTYFDPYWHIETAGSWFFGSLSAGQVDVLENPWPCTLPIISTCKMGGFSDLSTSQWVRKIQKGSLGDTTHVWRMWKSEKVQTKQRKVENLYELVMLTFDGVSPPISNHHFHHPARCLEPPRWPKPAKGAVPWLIDVGSQKINARCSKLGCETMIHSQRCEDLWHRSVMPFKLMRQSQEKQWGNGNLILLTCWGWKQSAWHDVSRCSRRAAEFVQYLRTSVVMPVM